MTEKQDRDTLAMNIWINHFPLHSGDIIRNIATDMHVMHLEQVWVYCWSLLSQTSLTTTLGLLKLCCTKFSAFFYLRYVCIGKLLINKYINSLNSGLHMVAFWTRMLKRRSTHLLPCSYTCTSIQPQPVYLLSSSWLYYSVPRVLHHQSKQW